MKKVTVETAKQELSKVDFYKIIEIATKKFTNACLFRNRNKTDTRICSGNS